MNTHANTAANGAEPIASRMDTTPLRFTAPPPDTGEIQKFLGSAAPLWAKQRDKLDELEAAYAAERFRKVEAFQKRMQALGNEAADSLRDFDRRHAAQMAEGRRMLAALDHLRDFVMPELLVVDLSHHNAVHDFSVARANGLVGVIHKATEGTTFTDETYWHRWEAARAAGLCWGSYHFLRHGNVGAQIDNYLSFADPDPGERVAIDYEHEDCDLVDLHLAVEAILAADPTLQICIYGGHLLKQQLGKDYAPLLAPHALWVAHYTSGEPTWPQGTWPVWSLWQYSDGQAGGEPRSIPGIAVPHDCNAFNGSAEQCRKWFGPGALPVPPVPRPEQAEVLVEVTTSPGVKVTVMVNGQAR